MLTQRGFLEALRVLLQSKEEWRECLWAEAGPRKEVRLYWRGDRTGYFPGLSEALLRLAYYHGWSRDTTPEDYVEFRPGYDLSF